MGNSLKADVIISSMSRGIKGGKLAELLVR